MVTPSLVLSYDFELEVFSWTWTGANPWGWLLMPTGSTDYLDDNLAFSTGDDRMRGSSATGRLYLIGVDMGYEAITPPSNEIEVGA